jgi:hypothetical protein
MQRAYNRGLSQSEARGHRRSPAGLSESQRRRQRTLERTGQTPSELFGFGFQQRYGFSYNYWRRLRRLYINELNERRSPGARMKPSHVFDIIQMYRLQGGDLMRPELRTWESWVEVHLGEALWATILYQDEHDSLYGSFNWSRRSAVPPIEYWFYH